MPWLEHESASLEVVDAFSALEGADGHNLISPHAPGRGVGKIAGLPGLDTSALRVSYGGPVPTNGHRCRIACDEEALCQCKRVQCPEEAFAEGADTL